MSRIALFTASEIEFRAAASLLEDRSPNGSFNISGRLGKSRIELFRTEMGPRCAAEQAGRALSRSKPEIVLVSGLAGSLSVECGEGDIALYRSCRFIEDGRDAAQRVECSSEFADRMKSLMLDAGLPVREGAGLTMNRMIFKAEEKRSAGVLYKAIAVDMESYQILSAAAESGARFGVLRAISDGAMHDLPDFNSAIREDGKADNLRMLMALAAHPAAAARFLFNLRRAVRRFKEALQCVLMKDF